MEVEKRQLRRNRRGMMNVSPGYCTKQTAGTEWGRRLTKAAKHQGPNVVTQVTSRLCSHWIHRRAKQPAGAGDNCQGEARAMFRFPWEA